MTKSALIDTSALLAGDPAAMNAWLEEIGPRIVLWAGARMSRALRARYEVEDVAQEVFSAVYRDLVRIGPRTEEGLMPWVFTVAENRIRDLAKAMNASKRNGEPPTPPRQRTPSSVVSRREQLHAVIAAMENLPSEQREAIRLRRFEGLSVRQAAERLDRSEGALRMLYLRAVSALDGELQRSAATGA